MRKPILIALIIGAALMLVLAACGGRKTEEPQQAKPPAATQEMMGTPIASIMKRPGTLIMTVTIMAYPPATGAGLIPWPPPKLVCLAVPRFLPKAVWPDLQGGVSC